MRHLTLIFASAGASQDRQDLAGEKMLSAAGAYQITDLTERLSADLSKDALVIPGTGPAVQDSMTLFRYLAKLVGRHTTINVASRPLPTLARNDEVMARGVVANLPDRMDTVICFGLPGQMSTWVHLLTEMQTQVGPGGAFRLQTLRPTTWAQAAETEVPFIVDQTFEPPRPFAPLALMP